MALPPRGSVVTFRFYAKRALQNEGGSIVPAQVAGVALENREVSKSLYLPEELVALLPGGLGYVHFSEGSVAGKFSSRKYSLDSRGETPYLRPLE